MAGRILVVGNDGITALDIEETLAANDYEVAMAVSVKPGAIRAALRRSPDLVVLDDSGSSAGGIATARQMCEKLRIPVVFLTALIAAEIEQFTKPTGLIGCLNKPFRDHDLLQLVGIIPFAAPGSATSTGSGT